MHILSVEQAYALPKGQRKEYAYNALDVVGTQEVAQVLLPRLDAHTQRTYSFERACQAPALAMMKRGIRVDVVKRAEAANEVKREMDAEIKAINLRKDLNAVWDQTEIEHGICRKNKNPNTGKLGHHKWPRGVPNSPERCCEHCGTSRFKRKDFNPNSSDQCKYLFYARLGIPEQLNKEKKVSVDDDILERLGRKYPKLYELTEAIRKVRDYKKQLGFLKCKLSADSRFHASVNVGTAWTGRWGTSKNPYGLGSNAQNISERHRGIFIADVGFDMFYADLEQAESKTVAYLSGDENYIEAHLVGDVHTYVARLIWPELPWTGDLKKDKVIAKQNPPWDLAPGHEYRFQAKRCQHGSNYGLSPPGIAMIEHIPLEQARIMYHRYFDNFPGIKAWQEAKRKQIVNHEPLINPLGRKLTLFGRPDDPHTYKQGLSFEPQSLVADVLNASIWRVWKELDLPDLQATRLALILMQVHDAILGEVRKGDKASLTRVLELMSIPIPVTDINGVTRMMTIGTEATWGHNFGKFHAKRNPFGQKLFVPD